MDVNCEPFHKHYSNILMPLNLNFKFYTTFLILQFMKKKKTNTNILQNLNIEENWLITNIMFEKLKYVHVL